MFCDIWMVSGRCPVDRNAVVLNGHDLEKLCLPFIADYVQISLDMSVSFGSLSEHFG